MTIPNSSTVVRADTETEVILPPPSASNPLPVLPVALQLDNHEQLLQFIGSSSNNEEEDDSSFLVFQDHALRVLLLRHVLKSKASSSASTTTAVKKQQQQQWNPRDSFPALDEHMGRKCRTWLVQDFVRESREGPQATTVTLFLRASVSNATTSCLRQMAQYCSSRQRSHSALSLRLVVLPQITDFFYKVVEHVGLLSPSSLSFPQNVVSLHSLQIDIFPLETDVLSMELFLYQQESSYYSQQSAFITTVARSLLQVQDVAGRIPRIQSYGIMAEEVVRKLLDMTIQDETSATTNTNNTHHRESTSSCNIDALLVLDRAVDYVTPMLTPLTYEALLDEVVGRVRAGGFLEIPRSIIDPPEKDAAPTTSQDKNNNRNEIVSLALQKNHHTHDSLFQQVRDQHVEQFGTFLQHQAMALKESHTNFTQTGRQKDLSEIHQFVKQIPVFTQNLRSLTNHIHLAELVKKESESMDFRFRWQTERSILEGDLCYDYLDELVATQHPPLDLLKLLCLQSVCSGGIRSSRYDSIRRDIVQTYGYEYVLVLQKLEDAGLLRRREGLWMDTTSSFNTLRKSMILINAEVDTVDPDDISYVSSGYAPLSVRLIQTAVKGWQGREDILREIPGRMVDITQQSKNHPPEDLATALKRRPTESLGAMAAGGEDPVVSSSNSRTKASSSRKPVLMVCYVGGITFMEIAALRFLSKRPSFPFHILICTTGVIKGSDLIDHIIAEEQ